MAYKFNRIVGSDRRITLPPEFIPGEAVEVTVRKLTPEESQAKIEDE